MQRSSFVPAGPEWFGVGFPQPFFGDGHAMVGGLLRIYGPQQQPAWLAVGHVDLVKQLLEFLGSVEVFSFRICRRLPLERPRLAVSDTVLVSLA